MGSGPAESAWEPPARGSMVFDACRWVRPAETGLFMELLGPPRVVQKSTCVAVLRSRFSCKPAGRRRARALRGTHCLPRACLVTLGPACVCRFGTCTAQATRSALMPSAMCWLALSAVSQSVAAAYGVVASASFALALCKGHQPATKLCAHGDSRPTRLQQASDSKNQYMHSGRGLVTNAHSRHVTGCPTSHKAQPGIVLTHIVL